MLRHFLSVNQKLLVLQTLIRTSRLTPVIDNHRNGPLLIQTIPICSTLSPIMSKKLIPSRIDEILSEPNRHLDYKALLEKQEEGSVVIIDVRDPVELTNTGSIPGSMNIPLGVLEEALYNITREAFRMRYGAEKPSKGDLIVFSCKSGRRSANALRKALQLGFLNSSHYAGGWVDWEEKSKQK